MVVSPKYRDLAVANHIVKIENDKVTVDGKPVHELIAYKVERTLDDAKPIVTISFRAGIEN